MTPDALARIHAAAFRRERAWSAAEFRALVATPHTHMTPCDQGFALWRCVAGEAELLTIAVDPLAQNTGIGRRLMTTWMTQAALSANTAFLEVAADNVPACKLYARFGFAVVGRRRNYYARATGHADALVMRASLPFTAI